MALGTQALGSPWRLNVKICGWQVAMCYVMQSQDLQILRRFTKPTKFLASLDFWFFDGNAHEAEGQVPGLRKL